MTTISAGALVLLALQAGATPAAPNASWAGWAEPCMFSHRNQDDPIRFPRQPGRSHDHTYFGNRSTNASSTPTSLRRNRRTTCGERADTSAYWAPTLFVAGRAIEPRGAVVKYFRRTNDPVAPLPAGLKMIAGDANARRAQSSSVTSWDCTVAGFPRSSTMPRCPRGRKRGLILRVAFPDCWDGRRLDSPNHQSHMAYSSDLACPGSHPVEVPQLTLWILYGVRGGPKTELASGGRFSAHADFVNAWHQPTLAALMQRYLNAPDAIGPPEEPPDPTGLGPCERCP